MSRKIVNVGFTIPKPRSNLLSGVFAYFLALFLLAGSGQSEARERDAAYKADESSAAWSLGGPVAPSRQVRLPGGIAARNAQLDPDQADLYRRIFELQDRTDWDAADALVGQVTDMRLMGHVELQRLMHPTAYKATYYEMRDWLERHADLPGADKVYQLALRRMAKGDRKPPAPRDSAGLPPGPNGAYASERGLQRSAPRGRSVQVASESFDPSILPAAVAAEESPAPVSSTPVNGSWAAGIAAWRIGQNDKAAKHFEALAKSDSASSWDRSAGAYWAARSHQRERRPAQANRWLTEAAAESRTFYGLIAKRALGGNPETGFHAPALTTQHLRALAEVPAGRRAIALVQTGRVDTAEQELRRIHPRGDEILEEALVALTDMAGMPALALHLGSVVMASDGAPYDSALYPLPRWEPVGGFTIDRSLVFALMRQESRFETDARSGAGARGLMQLMPSTATYVASSMDSGIDATPATGKPDLYVPEINLSLGQRYVRYLMDQKGIDDNLILTVAAYNAGPGNLQVWRRRMDQIKDPLLFIESLPARETRTFVEQVLTNYWMYQQRLGQPQPSLDAIAGGRWPVYMAMDSIDMDQQVAADGTDR